ncbi:hypothetical protein ScPMuIL_018754 [Solemya velum]
MFGRALPIRPLKTTPISKTSKEYGCLECMMASEANESLSDIENVDNLLEKYAIPSPVSTHFGMDVRVRRGADVGSDHHLVTANIKLKLQKISEQSRKRRYDTGKLKKSKIVEEFNLELKNRYQILQNRNSEDSVEEHWNKVEELYSKTSEKVLGFKRQVHKEWITPATWKTIDKRKDFKKKVCNARSERLKDRLRAQYS